MEFVPIMVWFMQALLLSVAKPTLLAFIIGVFGSLVARPILGERFTPKGAASTIRCGVIAAMLSAPVFMVLQFLAGTALSLTLVVAFVAGVFATYVDRARPHPSRP